MNVQEIKKLLPHRYPFLMVDKIVSISENEIKGLKNVTINEPFFQGHFPNDPIMPGVLLVEGLAQCGGILLLRESSNLENISTYFTTIDKVKFKNPVRPGDQVIYEVEVVQRSSMMTKLKGRVTVDNKVCAIVGEFAAVIVKAQG